MFDTHIHKTAASYPQTIYEHRAPTDKSVQLLKEFEEKALNKVVSAYPCKFNELDCTVIKYRDITHFGEIYMVKINLNGKERIFKTSLDNFSTPVEQALELKKKFAEFLSGEMLCGCDFKGVL